MASKPLLTVLTLVGLMLTGCVQEPVVEITRAKPVIRIAVHRPGTSAPTCVESVTVSRDGTGIATTPPLWQLSTAERARCRGDFPYGQVPDGYAQSASAPTLTVGARYLVEVSGPGLLGGRVFTMRATDGSLADPVAS